MSREENREENRKAKGEAAEVPLIVEDAEVAGTSVSPGINSDSCKLFNICPVCLRGPGRADLIESRPNLRAVITEHAWTSVSLPTPRLSSLPAGCHPGTQGRGNCHTTPDLQSPVVASESKETAGT